jgi:hypothetical protein
METRVKSKRIELKNILLHYHIFKNAGTTLEWIFKKNFGRFAISMDNVDDPGHIISNDVIKQYVIQHQRIRSISSHQIRFPIPELNEINFIPIVFLRHPIDRVISVYNFKKTMNDRTSGTMNAKKFLLNDFIFWSLATNYMVISNYQTNFLSSSESDTSKCDLKTALERMHALPIIGIVDRMNESLILAEEVLRRIFPKIDLSYVPQNMTADITKDLEDRLTALEHKIGHSTINLLKEKNSLDMKLYDAACKELDVRLQKISDLESKLSDFSMRCKNKFLSKLKVKTSSLIRKFEEKYLAQYDVK